MRQVLHLLIVDRERRAALAARYGPQWLLPVITCAEMSRAAPIAARWCAQRGLASDIAGQWLGRAGPDAIDWIMAIPARPAGSAAAPLEWIALDRLRAQSSIHSYQTWALATLVGRGALPFVAGPFGTLDWPEKVRRWIGESVGSLPDSWSPYRVSPHEVVLGAETASGRVYFKGLAADRSVEAALTATLASVAPDSFAPTLALERARDQSVWWLTGECAGRPSRDCSSVAAALAQVQQRLMPVAANSPVLGPVDLDSAVQWSCDGSDDIGHAALIRDAAATVTRADVPHAWIPMDLDPSNVLVDDDGAVRFIDVDDSFFGPAPLALAGFAGRSGDVSAYRPYQAAWSPALTGVEWRSFEIVATVFQAWLGWNRVNRNIERGEVHAPVDLVASRIRDRLARAIYRR